MDFTWLRTFIVAAECGNFRRTAEELHISQPAVTVHIKQLESEVGVKLFQRDGRRVKLTGEGKRYLTHAKELITVYQNGLEDINSFRQGYISKFLIGISPLIADTILPYVLKSYIKKNPEVEISVKIIDSADIESAVMREEVDLGLSCLNSTNPELSSELLYRDKVVFVAPHDGRDSETAPPLDEKEILESSRLLTHNHPGYWDELCQKIKNIYPGIRMMQVSQSHITKRFIAEGLGVSFLPLSTVRRELLEGRLLEVDCYSLKLPEANTYAIMKYSNSKQREFVNFISGYRF
ncbi:LysR family transcriptional regulator [Fictibacillus aquaticus]|uniref:LysR family transcriptional regulator n=1 Tax=Fictibacillus aquaticus TaxID=2021314 RepID=A0A235FDV2_9BACL|nr:LysR family transcriptional regulator [Fictibacillus aquaticus]OYD59501.1 LysR family transcriptional regulator [Fictibacillus aquaticus]